MENKTYSVNVAALLLKIGLNMHNLMLIYCFSLEFIVPTQKFKWNC